MTELTAGTWHSTYTYESSSRGETITDERKVDLNLAGQSVWIASLPADPSLLEMGWTPREQRHTFVSVLSDSGVDIEQIADAVGHVNSTVTKTVYRHQIADEITTVATAMDAIFGETGSP